ncbi:MAG: rhodanese-related sulfurtransferase, partial [Methyloligellaceae bacterium]
MEVKFSQSDDMPFLRLKVRVKDEIIKFEEPGLSPVDVVGTYVAPREWNGLIADPDTIVIDTRNLYETEIGTFQGAVDPKTYSFTEFKSFVADKLMNKRDQPVAMFCTGGIRCEKASSYLLSLGFQNVYHLKGGILKYLEEIPEEESLWQGQCFVFDERVSVGHGLEQGQYALCRACRMPISAEDQQHHLFIEGIQCHRCAESLSEKSRSRARERQHQIELAQKSGMVHMGDQATEDSKKRQAYKNFKKRKERAASKLKAS